jgi:hypothetical protein
MSEPNINNISDDIKKIMNNIELMNEKMTLEINKWSNITHKYNNELFLYIKQLEIKQNIEFNAIHQTLADIKERLTLYEIEPDFDESYN